MIQSGAELLFVGGRRRRGGQRREDELIGRRGSQGGIGSAFAEMLLEGARNGGWHVAELATVRFGAYPTVGLHVTR